MLSVVFSCLNVGQRMYSIVCALAKCASIVSKSILLRLRGRDVTVLCEVCI